MSKLKSTLIAIVTGLAIGVLIICGIFYLKLSVHGKMPPGTYVSGIDVSYKTPDEVEDILQKEATRYLNEELELKLRNTVIEKTPKELGVEVLVKETVQIIEETDAKKISILDWTGFVRKEPTTISILTKVDHEKLISELENGFMLKNLKPISASFYFDENKTLQIKEGKEGISLNESELVKDLKNSATQLKNEIIEVKMEREGPEITKETLEKEKNNIEKAIWHEFVLIDPIYSDDWTLKLADNIDWVNFEEEEVLILKDFPEVEMKKNTKLKINQDRLNEFIDSEISKWLDRPAEDVNIYKDENGEIIIEGKGKDGLEVQRALLKKSIELAVENEIRNVPIPIKTSEPKIIVSEELKELGIKEKIGTGHTSYYGSPSNRIHNIKTGANTMNGTLIAPGEVFSFNNTLGRVDGTTGYKKGLVIKEEGTIPEYGGGLCQVSTTVYRAILLSGLPVKERNEHSYAVSYYSQVMGHGLDATIYLGGADLKFENDTGSHILMQAFVEDDYELYVVFYGTDDGRKTELEGPYLSNYRNPGPTIYQETSDLQPGQTKQVEKSHTGFNAIWYRYITKNDGEIIKETIETNYRAIPAKILVGAGTPES
jgi:vancomycin resistance protein YoaR